jgi:hypothetical protein
LSGGLQHRLRQATAGQRGRPPAEQTTGKRKFFLSSFFTSIWKKQMDEAVSKLRFLKPAQTFFRTRDVLKNFGEKPLIVEPFPVKKEAIELFQNSEKF